MDYFINCITTNYANFSGRASRSEYWYFVLFCAVIGFILGFIGTFPGLKQMCFMIRCIFQLAILVPSIAVLARRMHDLDKSGWWQLIALIPIIGWIYMIILLCRRGTGGTNRFGRDPLPNA